MHLTKRIYLILKKILNYLDKKNDFKIEYSVEPKIDGISASLIYKMVNLLLDCLEVMVRRVKT